MSAKESRRSPWCSARCTAGGAYVPAMRTKRSSCEPGHHLPRRPAPGEGRHGEVVTAEDLGGGDPHSKVSVWTDHLAHDDRDAAAHRAPHRRDAGAAQTGGRSPWPPVEPVADQRSSTDVVPATPKPYDVREVITRIVDGANSPSSRAATGRRW